MRIQSFFCHQANLNHKGSLLWFQSWLDEMTPSQKERIEELGFSGLLRFQISQLDLLLIRWMAKMIDSTNMTLTLRGGQILPITSYDVVDTLGIPLCDIPIVITPKLRGI